MATRAKTSGRRHPVTLECADKALGPTTKILLVALQIMAQLAPLKVYMVQGGRGAEGASLEIQALTPFRLTPFGGHPKFE